MSVYNFALKKNLFYYPFDLSKHLVRFLSTISIFLFVNRNRLYLHVKPTYRMHEGPRRTIESNFCLWNCTKSRNHFVVWISLTSAAFPSEWRIRGGAHSSCIKYLFIQRFDWTRMLRRFNFPAKKSCDFNEFQKFDVFIPYFPCLIWLSKRVGVDVWNGTRSSLHKHIHVDVACGGPFKCLQRIQIRCDKHWLTLCHAYFGRRILYSATSAHISYHSRAIWIDFPISTNTELNIRTEK